MGEWAKNNNRTIVGECIHMDFRGPWPVRSLEGNRRQWRSSWCKPMQRRWKWRSGRFDSSHRYLLAITKEICYAIPPDDCKMADKPNMIWKVMKALYGSPQAGRRWS
eukprot:g78265.t1